jgi:predicted RND superfamily exporter protein
VAVAVVLVGAFGIAGLAQVKVETGLDSFLPANDPSVTQLDQMEKSFGGDPIVVLLESSKPEQLLGSQNLLPELKLEGTLAKLPNVAVVYGPATALNQIAGQAQDLLAELVGRRDALQALAVAQAKKGGATSAQANAAGQRALDQFDARYGPLLIQAMPAGLPTLANPSFVNSVIYDTAGDVRPQWHFIVPSPTAVAILVRPRQDMDAASTYSLIDSIRQTVGHAGIGAQRVTVSGVPVVASSIGDEVTREVPMIGGLAVLAVGACFLLIPWSPRRRRRLLPLGTTLISIASTLAVFGWIGRPLSLGVVAFLSVLLGVGSYYPTYFAQGARPRTVLTVATASAASFATLLLSPLPFVQELGLTLSLGVLLSALTGMWLTRRLSATATKTRPGLPVARSRRRTHWIVLAGVVAVAAAGLGWCALPNLPLQTNVESFAVGLSAMNDAQHVENVVGSSGEGDIMLTGPNVTSPAAFKWMQQAQDIAISDFGDQMRPALSLPTLLTFLGNDPTSEQVSAGMRLLPQYLSSAVVRGDNHAAVMDFGVQMNDLAALASLRDNLLRSLPPPPRGYQVSLTGLPMVAVRGQELVSGSRVLANVLGILAAGAVLTVGLQRRIYALRAVATAAIATGLGLFALWATHTALSDITVALGPLTAAVGCEFTVLLSESARSGNRSLRQSVLLATATSAVGYLVLVSSRLGVIQQFGILLAAAVVLAMESAFLVVGLTTRRRNQQTEPLQPTKKPLTEVSQ